jgi:hypothetical protein
MIEDFERLIKALGEAVHSQVATTLAGKHWGHAFLDVRYDKTGDAWLSKIRALGQGDESTSVKMNNQIDMYLISLNALRKAFGDEWYGLLLTVSADRCCEVKLNYDPECSEDSSFYST